MTGHEKSKGGRPSLYKPEYCETAIFLMGQGYSIAGLAGHLKVSRQTVYQWEKDHPEFSDALNAARAASAAWWERQAILLATGDGQGNASVVIFGLKNRVADEWRDKNQTEITGKDDGPVEVVTHEANEFARRIASIAAARSAGSGDGEAEPGGEGGA